MAASPYWKGFLEFSLVSVPVRAYKPSVSGAGEIHFNQLHAECHSRIQYKKTCPVHGEVRNEEVVSGFQYSKDKYVVIDPNELDNLRTEDDKAIMISAFVVCRHARVIKPSVPMPSSSTVEGSGTGAACCKAAAQVSPIRHAMQRRTLLIAVVCTVF